MSTLIFSSRFEETQVRCIEGAAERAGFHAEPFGGQDAAVAVLERSEGALALLLHGADGAEAQLAERVRRDPALEHLALLVAREHEESAAFEHAFRCGADDLVRVTEAGDGLQLRLLAVGAAARTVFTPRRGTALLAEPDPARSAAFARALKSAGFSVRSVFTEEEARASATDLRVGLCVLSAALVTDFPAHLALARRAGAMARVIAVAGDDDWMQLKQQLATDPAVRLLPACAVPDHLVFLANEMARPDLINQRATARELLGIPVRFAAAGLSGPTPELGFSYNVSLRGLYVRTMASPGPGTIDLSVRVPGEEERWLRLRGEVAWRRAFGHDGQATCPPGFGVRLTSAETADWKAWEMLARPGESP